MVVSRIFGRRLHCITKQPDDDGKSITFHFGEKALNMGEFMNGTPTKKE